MSYDYYRANPWAVRPYRSPNPEMDELIAALIWSVDPRQARPWSMTLRWERRVTRAQVRRLRRSVAADVRALPASVVQGVLADLASHLAPGLVLPTCPQCLVPDCCHQAERWMMDIDRLWEPSYRFEQSA